eukprot:scaffold7358_cov252-Pinguiococcus_pyrenoidosus.AAC.41
MKVSVIFGRQGPARTFLPRKERRAERRLLAHGKEMRSLTLLSLGLACARADRGGCQASCAAGAERLVGPTRPPNSRGHPFFPAPDPNENMQYCHTGCALFFEQFPAVTACEAQCDFLYRYDVSVGYSDHAEVARLECADGCRIGLLSCQAGYFCAGGQMLECAPGQYRNETDPIEACIDCPRGRYRGDSRGRRHRGLHPYPWRLRVKRTSSIGRYLEACKECPTGKFVNATGATRVESCLRVPPGRFSAVPDIVEESCQAGSFST